MRPYTQCLSWLALSLFSASAVASSALFGFEQSSRPNLDLFPQWLSVLERHLIEMAPAGDCEQTTFNRCHLKTWMRSLESMRGLSREEQVRTVNRFANQQKYVLDLENYGVDDYWATPLQFLEQNGDCEDYAIIKMLSLKRLGFDVADMRIVVVQDTNLRIPHAVMSLHLQDDIKILDNQISEVISHRDIYHYTPIYSINEQNWWMHLPKL